MIVQTRRSFLVLVVYGLAVCIVYQVIPMGWTQLVDKSIQEGLVGLGVDPRVWTAPVVPARAKTAAWDDPDLINHIRTYWILSPVTNTSDLIGIHKHYTPEAKTSVVDGIFRNKTGGFFVESGASDGIRSSDTVFLERERGWKGLLIEPDPTLFARLRRRRQNFMSKACVSPHDHASLLPFTHTNQSTLNGLTDYMAPSHYNNIRGCGIKNITVQCFPLASILKAIRVTRVDYLSLDLEGPELEVLQTLPLDQFDIEVIAVEYHVIGDSQATADKLQRLRVFLSHTKQYKEVHTNNTHDLILRKVYEYDDGQKLT